MRLKFKIIFFTYFSLFFIILYFIIFSLNKKNVNNLTIEKLPIILLKDVNNNFFSNNDIDNTKSRIIINHFSPTCEHCQYMAGEFIKDSQKLKDVQILMITSADSASAAKFNSDYKLSLLPNIIILRDTNYQFQKTFGTGVVPSFFIYEHNKLVKKVIGETTIENLIN